MASGNIELHRSRVDLTQLIQQAVGEHKEDLTQSQLDLRMTMPHDQSLHMWTVKSGGDLLII